MNKNLMIGAIFLMGAYWYMQQRKTASAYTATARPLGSGSVPGSVGTGISQQLGGILGNALSNTMGGGTQSGQPIDLNGLMGTMGDNTLNNNASAADPFSSFDPSMMA